MSVRTGMFPPPSVGPAASGMPGPMPPMGAAPNPFAPMPPMPLAGMPPPPMGGMPPPPMAQAPMPQPSSAGLGSVAGSNAPRRRMFGDFLESKLRGGQARPAPQMARPPQMQQQQRMVAPGTPAMRTPPMQSMMPRPMMYGGEVDVFGYEDGGFVPRQTMIGSQPHMLAYINPEEAQLLQDLGGTGEPGPGGVPAYRNIDADMYAGSRYAPTSNAGTSSASQTFSNQATSTGSFFDPFPNSNKSDDGPGYSQPYNPSGPSNAEIQAAAEAAAAQAEAEAAAAAEAERARLAEANRQAAIEMLSSGIGNVGGTSYFPSLSQARRDASARALANQQRLYGAGNQAVKDFDQFLLGLDRSSSPESIIRSGREAFSTLSPEQIGYPPATGTYYDPFSMDNEGANVFSPQSIVSSDSNFIQSQVPSGGLDVSQLSDPSVVQSELSRPVSVGEDSLPSVFDSSSISGSSSISEDYTPTSAELSAQLANAGLPDLRQSQFDVDMSQPKTLDFTTQNVFYEIEDIRKETEEKFAKDGDQSYYDETMAALDEVERDHRNKIADGSLDLFDLRDEDTEDMNNRYSRYLLNRQKEAGDFDGTILGEGEGGMSRIPEDSGIFGRNIDQLGPEEFRSQFDVAQGAGTVLDEEVSPGGALYDSTIQSIKDRISKVEGTSDSGGYDRLLGGSEARFGVKPSEMTIAEILDFQSNRGTGSYADYSQSVNEGRNVLRDDGTPAISTPVGKYQIVGRTLKDLLDRDVLASMGIDENTVFTPEVQEKIGTYLIQNRGFDAAVDPNISPSERSANLDKFKSGLGKEFEGISVRGYESSPNFTSSEPLPPTRGENLASISDYEQAKISEDLNARVPIGGLGKFILDVGEKLGLGLGKFITDPIREGLANQRQSVVEDHLTAIGMGAIPRYDEDGKYIGYISEFPEGQDVVTDFTFLPSLGSGSGSPMPPLDDGNDDSSIFASLGAGSTSGNNYTIDNQGNISCPEGYYYDNSKDMCVPISSGQDLNIGGSSQAETFDDVLARITKTAPKIKSLQNGGMAGLNRTADNFLRALGG